MLYRKSYQREKILELLRGTKTHPTADWIYQKLKDDLPDLSLGTVYRNLKVLAKQGQIQKLPFGSTYDRFDGNAAPHYHIVCQRCGSVHDLEMPEIEDLNRRAEESSSFTVTHHRVDFFGICQKCQTENNS